MFHYFYLCLILSICRCDLFFLPVRLCLSASVCLLSLPTCLPACLCLYICPRHTKWNRLWMVWAAFVNLWIRCMYSILLMARSEGEDPHTPRLRKCSPWYHGHSLLPIGMAYGTHIIFLVLCSHLENGLVVLRILTAFVLIRFGKCCGYFGQEFLVRSGDWWLM